MHRQHQYTLPGQGQRRRPRCGGGPPPWTRLWKLILMQLPNITFTSFTNRLLIFVLEYWIEVMGEVQSPVLGEEGRNSDCLGVWNAVNDGPVPVRCQCTAVYYTSMPVCQPGLQPLPCNCCTSRHSRPALQHSRPAASPHLLLLKGASTKSSNMVAFDRSLYVLLM